jgi:hypothetical protein
MHRILTYSLLSGALLIAGCKNQTEGDVTTKSSEGAVTTPAGDSAENRGTSLVRVVNAVPGSGSLWVRADRETPFDTVDYKSVTPYHEIRGNIVRFAVFPRSSTRAIDWAKDTAIGTPSDSGSLASNTETMRDGERYTIFLMPNDEGQGVTMRIVNDRLERDSAKAQIRFVNAAPRAGELDLTMQGREDAVFDNVNFKSEAGFKSIDPVRGIPLTVRRDDGRTSVAPVRGIKQLQAGKSYTVVVTGLPGQWEVITFEDEIDAKPSGSTR